MNPRILFLLSAVKNTGIASHALQSLFYLSRNVKASFFLGSAVKPPFSLNNVIVNTSFGPGSRGVCIGQKIADVKNLIAYVRQHRINVIHTFKMYDFFLAIAAKSLGNLDCIHVHSYSEGRRDNLALWVKLFRVDGMTFPGEKLRAQYHVQNLPFSSVKPFIYPDFPVQGFRKCCRPVRVLIVSKIAKDRNWNVLLDALTQHFPHLEFTIFGKGQFLSSLQGSLSGNQNVIRFAGHENLIGAYQQADVGLILSIGSDGYCRTLFEFFSQNIPVIGTKMPMLEDMLKSGSLGDIFESSDDLSEKLHALNSEKVDRWKQNILDVDPLDIQDRLEIYRKLYRI